MTSHIRSILATVTISLSLALQSTAQTWLANGTNPVEAANMKTSKGFGAQLWLTDETEEFFDNWNKDTPGVIIRPTRTAIRGKPFSTIIIFINPGTGSNWLCDVTGDIIVKKPDGTVYGEARDANVWRNLPPPGLNQLQLAVDSLGIVIEEDDPSGRYTVESTVIDHVKNTQVTLTEYFDVDQEGNGELQQGVAGYGAQGAPYPER